MNAQRKAFVEAHLDFRVDVPEGTSGLWTVKRVQVDKRNAEISNALGTVTKTERFALVGTYTVLERCGILSNPYDSQIFMSDQHCEVADHRELVEFAQAHAPLERVLINGLGLGVAIELLVPYVRHIVNVELSKSVIKLVGTHYLAKYPGQVEIIEHDALTYKPPPGTRYDACFHDIWPTISHDNLAEMSHLERRYGHYTNWQQSWGRKYCERIARQRKAHPEKYEGEIDMQAVLSAIRKVYDLAES